MTPRFILITAAAILLVACDRRSAEMEAAKSAELAQQRQSEQADKDKIQQLEDRISATEQLKSAEREAELARVKEELAQVKKDKELAAKRIRDLQDESNKPAPPPIARAPGQESAEPRGDAIRADLERTVEDEEDREPVYVGRVVPETQQVVNVQAFYEPLDPYGDWIETDDYGYVFRPQIATRPGWRPYTDGHWVHTGYGWTWQSNEDFGWATYHYGRWSRIASAGWVWVPGREWGPGWVSWRRGPEHCGWAPLPPESRTHFSFTATVDRDYDIGPAAYVFVSLSNFGARSYAPVIERPEQNVAIINKTVNVTNITYNNTTNNRAVYNGGPSYNLVRARSKQPVENVNLNFAPQNTTNNKTKIVNVRQGDTLQVAAAPVAAATVTAPLRVKEKIAKPKEDKGWDGVDPAQAQTVKQAIVATSTERPRRPRPVVGAAPPATPAAATPAAAAPLQSKPGAPAKSVAVEPAPNSKPLNPESANPTPTPRILPKAIKPETPLKSDDVEKPKRPLPETPMPKPAIESSPKPDKPAVSRPADVPIRPKIEPPTTVKHPTPEPATPRAPKIDRNPIVNAPENPPSTPVTKRFAPDSPPVPPQRATQEPRAPEPHVDRPAPQPAPSAAEAAARAERIRERSMHPENPAPQRAPQAVAPHPPQSVAPPQPPHPKPSSEEQDKKKKKKEGEQ